MIEEGVRNRTQARTRSLLSKLFVACAALSCAFFVAPLANGQTAEGTPARTSQASGLRAHLIGVVTSLDAATGQLTVRTDAGASLMVSTNEKTSYLRLPPGETRMEAATSITRADVRVGDRVLVPGGASEGAQAAPARQVIVTSAAAAATGGAGRAGEDMRARRVVGRVTRVDPARKEVVVQSRTRDGSEDVTVTASGDARLLRFAPDSIRPADARQSTFEELRVGDQLRATGERSSDGTRFTAQEIISGTFARVAGQVSSVDAGRGEVTVKGEQNGETFIINVGKNSVLKRVSAEAAEAFAQRRGARREERGAAGGNNEEGQRGERRRERAARGEGRNGERPRGGGGRRKPHAVVGELARRHRGRVEERRHSARHRLDRRGRFARDGADARDRRRRLPSSPAKARRRRLEEHESGASGHGARRRDGQQRRAAAVAV